MKNKKDLIFEIIFDLFHNLNSPLISDIIEYYKANNYSKEELTYLFIEYIKEIYKEV